MLRHPSALIKRTLLCQIARSSTFHQHPSLLSSVPQSQHYRISIGSVHEPKYFHTSSQWLHVPLGQAESSLASWFGPKKFEGDPLEQVEQATIQSIKRFETESNMNAWLPFLKDDLLLDDKVRERKIRTVMDVRLHFAKMMLKLRFKYSIVNFEVVGSVINPGERKISLIWRLSSRNMNLLPFVLPSESRYSWRKFKRIFGRKSDDKKQPDPDMKHADEFFELFVAEDGLVERIVIRAVTQADYALIEQAEAIKEEKRKCEAAVVAAAEAAEYAAKEANLAAENTAKEANLAATTVSADSATVGR